MHSDIIQIDCHSLGYRLVNSDPEGRFTIVKEITSDPHLPCILQRTKFQSDRNLNLYFLCAPHLEIGGKSNNGYAIEIAAAKYLILHGLVTPQERWEQSSGFSAATLANMYLGRPTGSAMPLLWSHSEYIKLLRSTLDGRVYDYIPEVGDRYLEDRSRCRLLEIWQPNRQVTQVKPDYTLRIQLPKSFTLEWTDDDW